MNTNINVGEEMEKLGGGWQLLEDKKKIFKDFRLPDFSSAIAFVGKVGEEAEQRNHHPAININFTTVTFTLTTHDAVQLTDLDFQLAGAIDEIYDNFTTK